MSFLKSAMQRQRGGISASTTTGPGRLLSGVAWPALKRMVSTSAAPGRAGVRDPVPVAGRCGRRLAVGCLAVNTVSIVAATSVSARQPASSGSTTPSLVSGP